MYRLILQFRCWDKNAVSSFHQLLQKFSFDLNDICTTVADYNRDAIAKIVAQDFLYKFFKLIFTVVSTSSLRNVQSVPLIWPNDPEKSKLRQNVFLEWNLNSLRSHSYKNYDLLGFLRFRGLKFFRGFEVFWYTLYVEVTLLNNFMLTRHRSYFD